MYTIIQFFKKKKVSFFVIHFFFKKGQLWAQDHKVWLWIRYPVEEINFFTLAQPLSRHSAALSSTTQHATPTEFVGQ